MENKIERGSGSAGPSEPTRAERLAASERSEPTAIEEHERSETRDLNHPSRLADEAKTQMDKQAADLRVAKVPIETEPPTVYRP